MTHEQLEREMNYRIAMTIAKDMLRNGVITEAEYAVIDTIMIEKFRSILYGLYPQNNLIK
ncbi:MAG: SHOCT domain-containing protein [Eubacteriales bacterium]